MIQNRPAYAIDCVDHALHLARLLQSEGPLGVSEAADRLGVARSTAHRLLAMLVYRGFAEQVADRRYRASELLKPIPPTAAPVRLLRRLAPRWLHSVVDRTDETSTLAVLAGTEARILLTLQCDQCVRVGDREDRALPAHLSSGGKAMLAALQSRELRDLYSTSQSIDLAALRRELTLVRRRGWAINNQRTEIGVTAIGVPVRGPGGRVVAALAIAMPSVRFDHDRLPKWVSALAASAAGLQADLCHALSSEDSVPQNTLRESVKTA
jgi:IclR family transcriptional regulator, acetate operon repressor